MTRPPKPEPTEAFRRFKASMILDYGKWRDGEPYDIPALAHVTDAEREELTNEIVARR